MMSITKEMYIYFILNETGVIVGTTVTDEQYNPVPINMKYMGNLDYIIYTDTSGLQPQQISSPNSLFNMKLSRLTDYIYTKKWNDELNIFESYNIQNRILSKFAFNKRFTMEESIGIIEAAKVNSTIQYIYNNFNIADNIDLDDPDVEAGLNVLVSAELLTNERKIEILS